MSEFEQNRSTDILRNPGGTIGAEPTVIALSPDPGVRVRDHWEHGYVWGK